MYVFSSLHKSNQPVQKKRLNKSLFSISWRERRDSVTNISYTGAQEISRPRLAVSRTRETSLRFPRPYASEAVHSLHLPQDTKIPVKRPGFLTWRGGRYAVGNDFPGILEKMMGNWDIVRVTIERANALLNQFQS
jgi:hypothetical protein